MIMTLLGCDSKTVKTDQISHSEIANYQQVMEDLKTYLEKENGQLWSHQLYGSLMLVNPKNRIVFANEPDNAAILTKNGSIYTGILPDEINIANTFIEWNGKRWTTVILPLPEDANERMNLLTHELFHRIQPEIGFDNLPYETSDHLDTKEGRIYLKLELEALKMALNTENIDMQNQYIRDAIIFREYRYQLFPGSKEIENILEINEGLAEYTGSILSGRNDSLLRCHYVQFIETLSENPTFISSFTYLTIPVYGFFMQKSDKHWNLKITKETNLTDFITDFNEIEISDSLNNYVVRIRDDYNYQQINDYEIKRDEDKKALLALLDSKFKKNPVLVIPFKNMNISFNPGNLVPYRDMGTYYPNLRITDNWGILTVENGALVSKNWDKVIVTEPTETNGEISGDGWTLELKNGWKIEKSDANYFVAK